MSLSPHTMQDLPAASPPPLLRRLFRSHWTFALLQVLDLLTTIAVFHFGGFEVNPLVGRFTEHFGRFKGVLLSKLIAVALALGVRRLLWVINLFYLGIVCWNVLILLLLSIAN
jgi:uncharacterized protein DUF5658